jgi:hypothetical protein
MKKSLASGLCTLGLLVTAFSAQAEAFMHNTQIAVFKTNTSPHLILVGQDDESGGDPPGNEGGMGGHGGGHD